MSDEDEGLSVYEGSVEAVVRLPYRLPVAGESLGRTYQTQLGGLSVDVIFPSLADGPQGDPVVAPPEVRAVRSGIDWGEYLEDPWAWGTVDYWQSGGGIGGVIRASIRHVLLRVTLPAEARTNHLESAQAVADQLTALIEPWLHDVRDWVESVLAISLPSDPTSAYRVGDEINVWAFDGTKGSRPRSVLTIGGSVTVGDTPKLDSQSFIDVLQKVASGEAPPTEHLLLRDGRASLSRGEARRVVLDAATAAELALNGVLDSEISATVEHIQQAVRSANTDLGRLVSTLRKFGVSLPSNIEDDLIKPRNGAIHGRVNPSTDQARKAMDIASALVELVYPRINLLD